MVGWGGGECGVEVGEATDAHALDGIDRLATPQFALRQATLQRALVAEHQQHAVLARDLAQPLADGVALAQDVGVVVEEHHADDLDAMTTLFELRQDHLAELVAGGVPAGAEDVCDLHDGNPFLGWRFAAHMLTLP